MDNTGFDVGDVKFEAHSGLVPAIVQDARSGRVLMLGYISRLALLRTLETRRVTFFSRRRQELWTKGETSGNWLELAEIQPDCDADTLLVRAIPHGPTCHTGAPSCFSEPEQLTLGEVLVELYDVIESRRREMPEGSYTSRLFKEGASRIAQKVAEEAVELALESVAARRGIRDEAADLLYHTLVLLCAHRIGPSEVARILAARRGQRRVPED